MKKNQKFQSLEDAILFLQEQGKHQSISIEKILTAFSGKGKALILILLSLPFCQPLQIPGLSTPFGLLIAFIGFRMVFGKHVWLPKKLLAKTISPTTFQKITDRLLSLVKKIKPWIHPRLNGIYDAPGMEVVNGLVICFLGLFLALPLPIPLSNLSAAWSIFFIALGILESDGILAIIGYAICLLTIAILVGIGISIKHILQS